MDDDMDGQKPGKREWKNALAQAVLEAVGQMQAAGADVRMSEMYGESEQPYVALMVVNLPGEWVARWTMKE